MSAREYVCERSIYERSIYERSISVRSMSLREVCLLVQLRGLHLMGVALSRACISEACISDDLRSINSKHHKYVDVTIIVDAWARKGRGRREYQAFDTALTNVPPFSVKKRDWTRMIGDWM
jgi:hypothetical protein